MIIVQTPTFKRRFKKFNATQRQIIKEAVRKIIFKPEIGIIKTGDLAGVRVYKFKMLNQEMLIAYEGLGRIVLLAIGTHENFYRDLKR
jgi:mRNA-degrading endonuclease RelE of RelBE toxin-antitoxin system